MKKVMIILLCLSLMPAYAAQRAQSPKYHPQNLPVMTGAEEFHGPIAYPPYFELPGLDEVDLIGDTITIGTTWYENQHNGTCGRMLDISSDGYVHFGWMEGYGPEPATRHVWYNAYQLATQRLVFDDGIPIDNQSSRGGFITLDTGYGGKAFPAFHQVTTDPSGNPHTAVAFDIGPHYGAFTAMEVPWLYDPYGYPLQIIWPKMQMDRQGRMHILSTEYVASAGEPQRQFYTPGEYDPLSYMITYPTQPDSAFRMISWTMTLAGEVATSEVSDRVAFGWTYPLAVGFPGISTSQIDNDIWILIDEDGLNPNFSQAFNLTNFIPPDLSLLPDTIAAMKDTLRAYTDMNLFFDQSDWLHAVFTTRHYNSIDTSTYWHTSIVWHWSEQHPNDFQMIHNAFDDWWVGWYPGGQSGFSSVYCGAWNVKAQRPSLGQDSTTGYLYCMYQVYDCDTTHLSAFIGQSGWGMPSGEIYLSVSTDGGLSWSVGTNVTNTITPNHALPGQCRSELTPSLAKLVDGYCHIQYVYDLDAGNVIQTEGSATNNPVRYHQVPVSQIPTTPLVPQTVPFHVGGGTGEIIVVQPSTINFGNVPISPLIPPVQTFNIVYQGPDSAEVFAVTSSVPNFSTNFPPGGVVLQPYVPFGVQVTFNPSNQTTYAGDLIVQTSLDTLFVTVSGSGIAPLSADLTPIGSLIIPPGGGAISFIVEIENQSTRSYASDFWMNVQIPNGVQFTTLGPVQISLAGGASLSRLRQQLVPGHAPPGNYKLYALLGDYPWIVDDLDSLLFTKTGALDSAPWVYDPEAWANCGEDLTQQNATINRMDAMPDAYAFYQNSPNPFNASTVLSYQLPVASFVSLRVYDSAGRLVMTLVDGWRSAGEHELTWDASDLAAGMYFAKLEAGNYLGVQKIVMIK